MTDESVLSQGDQKLSCKEGAPKWDFRRQYKGQVPREWNLDLTLGEEKREAVWIFFPPKHFFALADSPGQ